MPVTLRIDGASRRAAIEPRTTPAETLRDESGLTGTKAVCGHTSFSARLLRLDA